MRRPALLLLLLAALSIVGCGGSTSSPDEAPSADSAAQSDSDDPSDSDSTADANSVVKGKWGQSGTVMAKIDSVREASKLTYQGTAISDVTPKGKAVTKKAGSGAKYVFVTATVKNDGKGGIDLTCGGTVNPDLIDDDDRHFTLINGFDQFKGNPECNVPLDPGFKDTVTWAFKLPSDATPKALELIDNTDINEPGEPVLLSVN